jgi:hypothetical protein
MVTRHMILMDIVTAMAMTYTEQQQMAHQLGMGQLLAVCPLDARTRQHRRVVRLLVAERTRSWQCIPIKARDHVSADFAFLADIHNLYQPSIRCLWRVLSTVVCCRLEQDSTRVLPVHPILMLTTFPVLPDRL